MARFLLQIADSLFKEQHLVLSSSDRDEVVDSCTRMLRPHQLVVKGKFQEIDARLHTVSLGSLSVNRLCFGRNVSVIPSIPEQDHFFVTLPLQGSANFTYGSTSVDLSEGRGAIVGPYEAFKLDTQAAFDRLIIRLDRRRVETVCADMLGMSDLRPVHFNPALDVLRVFWPGLIETVAGLSAFSDFPAYPRLLGQIETLIIETLILTQPNNFSSLLADDTKPVPSIQIKRAVEYMRENVTAPIRLSDVARHCGLSVRSLQAGFQRDLGTSPGRWLRFQRLEKVYEILSRAIPGGVSVTDVALECGFSHLGEFTTQFKARYGRRPSDVLAKRA